MQTLYMYVVWSTYIPDDQVVARDEGRQAIIGGDIYHSSASVLEWSCHLLRLLQNIGGCNTTESL